MPAAVLDHTWKHTSTMRKVSLLILGAGMAGLGAGIEAQRRDIDSLILEADDAVGGLCRNTTVHGCDFDFGPKILILDDSDNSKDILSFLGDNYEKHPMQESVYLTEYGLLGFPLQRNLIDLPRHVRDRVCDDIQAIAVTSPKTTRSYKDWLISNYGTYLSEHVLIPYEEKKWQVPLNELDYEWALSRPVRVDANEVKEGAKRKLPPDRFYYYPKAGNISTLTKSMANVAGPILLGHKVTKIDPIKKVVIASGEEFHYETLVSSVPLDYLISITESVSDEILRQSSLLKPLSIRVFNLVFEGNIDLDGTAIYFPEKSFVFRRVSVLQNLCPALARNGMTPISIEVSMGSVSDLVTQEQMLGAILEQFQKIPQFSKMGRLLAHETLEISFAYPLQTKGLRSYVSMVHGHLNQLNMHFIGRGGNYDYCNSDKAYAQGKKIVATIA